MEATLKIEAVVETAIYVDDLQAAETFYRTVLGLPVVGKEPGRHVFFAVRLPLPHSECRPAGKGRGQERALGRRGVRRFRQ
jgi:catechol 2,3-dioxygenase-like lactoylglutathione lyase family enzyme